jgi:Fe-S-cluster containining protein
MPEPLFPPLFAHWLQPRLPLQVSEKLATCEDCAMVTPVGVTRDPGPFSARLKCCTYFPYVANFALGAMLSKNDGTLAVRLAQAKTEGLFLPTGLHPTAERLQKIETLKFGQDAALLCPFYDSQKNGCAVWQNRPGVCATYFCKSERGTDGLAYWKNAEKYLNAFEWALAQQVLVKLDIGADEIEMCKAALSIEEPGEERDYFLRLAWGRWLGQEHEFYQESLRLARTISSEDLGQILGPPNLELERWLNSRI